LDSKSREFLTETSELEVDDDTLYFYQILSLNVLPQNKYWGILLTRKITTVLMMQRVKRRKLNNKIMKQIKIARMISPRREENALWHHIMILFIRATSPDAIGRS
jgi:hypothetical protein